MSGSAATASPQESHSDKEHVVLPGGAVLVKKRARTSRACDYCRGHKLRCEWLPEDPARSTPMCRHCFQFDKTCTLSAPARAAARRKITHLEPHAHRPEVIDEPSSAGAGPMAAAMLLRAAAETTTDRWSGTSSPVATPDGQTEPRILGPTSLTHLLGEMPPDPEVTIHDHFFGHDRAEDVVFTGPAPSLPPEAETRVIEDNLAQETIILLLNDYADRIAPLNPVITPAEISDHSSLAPVTIMAVAGIASLSRTYPHHLFASVRARLHALIEETDVMRTSTFANIQTLLITTMSAELNGVTSVAASSLSWIRMGTAIRMAQDLGFHRSAHHVTPEIQQARRRLWLSCIIADRWYGCSYGQPLTIQLEDCDDPLAGYNDKLANDPSETFQVAMYKLSVILGRILHAVYRPGALKRASQELLDGLLADVDRWAADLPEELKFIGSRTSPHGGFLHLLLVCVETVLLRPFVKQGRQLPSNVTFRPTPSRWFTTVNRSSRAIEWMVERGDFILDAWYIGFYGTVYSSLVQFHEHLVSSDPAALASLLSVRQSFERWAQGNGDGELTLRRKVLDIIRLLYKAAEHRHVPPSRAPLPTGMVAQRSSQEPPPARDGLSAYSWLTSPGAPAPLPFPSFETPNSHEDHPSVSSSTTPNLDGFLQVEGWSESMLFNQMDNQWLMLPDTLL